MPAQLRRATAPIALLGLAAALAIPAPAAQAKDEFVPGTGSASAGVVRVSMRSSGASIGVGLAQTRARFAGAQGNAESAGVDMGMFDTIGKAPIACDTAFGSFVPKTPARSASSCPPGRVRTRRPAPRSAPALPSKS